MAITGLVRFAAVSLLVSAFACFGDELTDQEVRQGIVKFLMPRCGGNAGENDSPGPALAEYLGLGGDTSRIARLLAEVAETNSAWYSEMAMHELARYGTPAQLPFLYSCATNPAIGNLAVRAVFNIEGITSNSLEVARSYLFSTNKFSFDGVAHRANVCVDLFTNVYGDSNLAELRPRALETATNFMDAVEIMPNVLDGELCRLYDGFQISRRRLSSLRSARERIIAELVDATTNNYEVGRRTHCYIAQTNYLQNAINELVAYPEAELPD